MAPELVRRHCSRENWDFASPAADARDEAALAEVEATLVRGPALVLLLEKVCAE